MIDILPLGSSSAGNAYRVTDGQTALLLEAGLPLKTIQRALNFRLSSIAGCLMTHEHGDHSKAAADLMRAGINVYASQGTMNVLRLSGHRAILVKAKQELQIGTWTVLPFDVQHDTADPLGFLLANQNGEKLLFATDTYYLKYRFVGLTHIMLEVNFCEDILREKIVSGVTPEVMRKRLMRSHMSLENAVEFFKANDLSKVQEIHLLHLSDSNSDEHLIKTTIQRVTGKPVYVAGR